MGMLLSLLVAEKSGFDIASLPGGNVLQDFSDKISQDAMKNIEEAMQANVGLVPNGKNDLNLATAGALGTGASEPAARPLVETHPPANSGS